MEPEQEDADDLAKEAMVRIIREKLEEYGTVNLRAAKENLPSLLLINDLSELLDQIAIQLPGLYGAPECA